MNNNIITAVFGAMREAKVRPRYRYDTGQVLVFRGVPNLPDFFEVYFANEGSTREEPPYLGTPEGVVIPNEYFESGSTILAYAHVYDLATQGTTIYKVTIPILPRPRPAIVEPEPEDENIIRQAIVALNGARKTLTDLEDELSEARDNANRAADRLSEISMTVEMLAPSVAPVATVTQDDHSTTFDLQIPRSNVAYAAFDVDDGMELKMYTPEGYGGMGFELMDGCLAVILDGSDALSFRDGDSAWY